MNIVFLVSLLAKTFNTDSCFGRYCSQLQFLHCCSCCIVELTWPGFTLFPLLTVSSRVSAWFFRTLACFLFPDTNGHLRTWQQCLFFFCFFLHLPVYIYVSTTPSSMTQYPLITFCFNLMHSPSQYLVPSLSEPPHPYCSHLLYSPRFLSWWNCLSL